MRSKKPGNETQVLLATMMAAPPSARLARDTLRFRFPGSTAASFR